MVKMSVRIWKPSTSASVQIITLFQRRPDRSNADRSLLALVRTSTPQPSTRMRSVMISFLKILSKSAFRQLRILPRTGMMAWNSESRPCLHEPSAESPSTMYSSRRETSLVRQSTNFCTRLDTSRLPDSFFLMLRRARSACSRLRLLMSTCSAIFSASSLFSMK